MSTTLTLNGIYNTLLNNNTVEIQTPEDWNLIVFLLGQYNTNYSSQDFVCTNPYDESDVLTIPVSNWATIRDARKNFKLINDLDFKHGDIPWQLFHGRYQQNTPYDNNSLSRNTYLDGNGQKICNVFFNATEAARGSGPILFPDRYISNFTLENCYFKLLSPFANNESGSLYRNSVINLQKGEEDTISNIIIKDCRFDFSSLDVISPYIFSNFSLVEGVQSASTFFARGAASMNQWVFHSIYLINVVLTQKCCFLDTIFKMGGRASLWGGIFNIYCYNITPTVQRCFSRNRYKNVSLISEYYRSGATRTRANVIMVYDAPVVIDSEDITVGYQCATIAVTGAYVDTTSCYFDKENLEGKVNYWTSSDPDDYGLSTATLQSVAQMQLRGWDVVSY